MIDWQLVESMEDDMGHVVRKRFEEPDDRRSLPNTEMASVKLAEGTAARATMQPGWRWSEVLKPVMGTDSCQMHHLGYALSGTLHVVTNEGEELDITAGDAYEILPGHDAWVVGDRRSRGWSSGARPRRRTARSRSPTRIPPLASVRSVRPR